MSEPCKNSAKCGFMRISEIKGHPIWEAENQKKYGDKKPRHCCHACQSSGGGRHGPKCEKKPAPKPKAPPKPKMGVRIGRMGEEILWNPNPDGFLGTPARPAKFNPED